ncbi:putative signal peptide peptidase SppA [Abditibacteriota bacterium]|nr:putative signal peptide peptidase SppA [Abditibacteriota bacterium]
MDANVSPAPAPVSPSDVPPPSVAPPVVVTGPPTPVPVFAPVPVPPRKISFWKVFWIVVVSGILLLWIWGAIASLVAASQPQIGLIEVSGAITDQGAKGLLGAGSAGGAREFMEQTEKAEKDDSVKAVVIRINSPGGSASASQEMFEAVQRLRAKKPVICSMGDVAASGGYYIAAGCDKIYANPATLTGSIGVISEFPNYSELFRKVGLGATTIKSGKFKDAGNPARPLTAEEKQLFQDMVNSIFAEFKNDVVRGRKAATGGKLTAEKLASLATGRVFTGRQAKAALLVDENGGLYDAIQDAAKRANITGTPKIKEFSSGGGLGALFGASSSSGILGAITNTFGESVGRGAVRELQQQTQSNLPTIY